MTTMCLLTWNIWGKKGDWKAREDALLAAIADADIVTVQEPWTEPGGGPQAARLAAALGFAHYHQADPLPPIPDHGSDLLSRWPITRRENHRPDRRRRA